MPKTNTAELLGKDAESLLKHKSTTIPKEQLHLPGPDFVDRIFVQSNRNVQTLMSLQSLFGTGQHWTRVVMYRETDRYVRALDYRSLHALEIGGKVRLLPPRDHGD